MTTRKKIKLLASIILGAGISVLSFFAFIVFSFSADGRMLLIPLIAFYVSSLLFLVLWNILRSRIKYILLGVPASCLAAGIIVNEYTNYISGIPRLDETEVNIYLYEPFRERTPLAELQKAASYKIQDNLPVIDGATALYPVYAAFVQAVYPEGEYNPQTSSVLCSKTKDAYNNLLEGKADIIFCAGPSKEQMQSFQDRGIKITLVPIGREAFVFFVNRENRINNVHIEDIQGIYSGEIRNWKELGGDFGSIKAYQRPDNSGSQTALLKIMDGIPVVNPPREDVARGMGSIINRVASYRNFENALGYSFLHFATEMINRKEIKLLQVNSVYPSKETIQNESYPLCDVFYAVYVEKNDINKNVRPFIRWIVSQEGQEIIEKTGYVPIIKIEN